MFPYWLLFGLCAAGAVQHKPDARTIQGGPFLIAAALVILLMVGLRYEVGGDWRNYLQIYNFMGYADFGEVLTMSDPGYALLNWVGQKLGFQIWFVNLVCAVIFTWGLAAFARRQPNPWLAVLVAVPYLIIVVAMGYTRQAVAIGFLLAGLSRVTDRESLIRFGFYVIAAALFHRTVIIVLPLAALAATNNRWLIAALGAVLGLMLFYFLLNAQFDLLLDVYETQDYDSQGAAVRVAMNVVPASIFLLLGKRFNLTDFERKLWRNFSFAAFVALALLGLLQSSTLVDRLALYLIPVQLFVFSRLPLLFGAEGRQNAPVLLAIIAYSAIVQFVWLTSAVHATLWLPYQMYGFQEENYT